MKISEIANKLNTLSEGYKIGELQSLRKQIKGFTRVRTYNIFDANTSHDVGGWAFHVGGRREFQFNIGFEEETGFFRFGLAFSLEKNISLLEPVLVLAPKIDRANQFIKENLKELNKYETWHYSGGGRSANSPIRTIDQELKKEGTFIFIGKKFEKPLKNISDKDLHFVLETFDELLAFYKYVESTPEIQVNESRIARLTWNTNGWVMPSGPVGKSYHPSSHEGKYGYGHEEWLMDLSKTIDGYHYAFLEPIRKQQNAFTGNLYNVWLYTIDGNSKRRYWIGEINDVEVLDKIEAEKAKKFYIKKGWLKQMSNQIKLSGAKSKGFSNFKGVDLFNVRFKPENIRLNDVYFELPKDHRIYSQSRYVFAFYKEEFSANELNSKSKSFFEEDDKHDESHELNAVKQRTHYREIKPVQITYLHELISQKLTAHLKKIYGVKNVRREHPAGYGGNRIDIVVNVSDKLLFYEIKTYASLRVSIREALGQIMEYSHWPNKSRAHELIIITQPHKDCKEETEYLHHLGRKFSIPLCYQTYDWEKDELSSIVPSSIKK